MTLRGLTVAVDHEQIGDREWRINGAVSLPLRRYVMYWDQICYVYGNATRGATGSFGETADCQLLLSEKILSSAEVDMDIRFPKKVRRASAVVIDDIPIEAWSELTFRQRTIAAEHLNSTTDDLWSVGQVGMDMLRTSDIQEIDAAIFEIIGGLPVPSEDVPLEKIISFRRQRRAELLALRDAIDQMADGVASAENKVDSIKRARERIDRALLDLHRLLDESKIERFASSVRTVLGFDEPKAVPVLLAALGAGASEATIHNIPLSALVGFGVNAAVNVSVKKTPKIYTLPDSVRDFVYLYEAGKLKAASPSSV